MNISDWQHDQNRKEMARLTALGFEIEVSSEGYDACFEQGDGREVCERLFRLALAGDARFAQFEPRPLAPRGDQLALA